VVVGGMNVDLAPIAGLALVLLVVGLILWRGDK
jgi:hypothetical protein